MPRGNDSQAATSELADRFSEGRGNAEELIEANNQERSLELVSASMKKIDEDATKEAREDLSKLSGPNGEEVLDAAVRGGDTIVVYEDEDGRVKKAVADEGGSKKGGSKKSGSKANTRAQSSKDEEDGDSK